MKTFSKFAILLITSLCAQFAQVQTAQAEGNDGISGGTYAVCDKQVFEYHTEISAIEGYAQYSDILSALASKLPLLAKRIREIEKFDWYYFKESDGCKFVSTTNHAHVNPLLTPVVLDQPVTFAPEVASIYVRSDKFDPLKKKGGALINEGLRKICATIYHEPQQTSCVWLATEILMDHALNESGQQLRDRLKNANISLLRTEWGITPADIADGLNEIVRRRPLFESIFAEREKLLQAAIANKCYTARIDTSVRSAQVQIECIIKKGPNPISYIPLFAVVTGFNDRYIPTVLTVESAYWLDILRLQTIEAESPNRWIGLTEPRAAGLDYLKYLLTSDGQEQHPPSHRSIEDDGDLDLLMLNSESELFDYLYRNGRF